MSLITRMRNYSMPLVIYIMTVNGTVQLTATFQGKSTLVDASVSEDLKYTVLLSRYDAKELGSIPIARYANLGDPSEKVTIIKKKFSRILKDFLSDKPIQRALNTWRGRLQHFLQLLYNQNFKK